MTTVYGALNFYLKVIVKNKTSNKLRNIAFECKEDSKLFQVIKKVSYDSKEFVLVDNTGYEGVKPLYMIFDDKKYLISEEIKGNWNGYVYIEIKNVENGIVEFTVNDNYIVY